MDLTHAPFIRTVRGDKFYFVAPSIVELRIEDIARALSFMPRFGGHTTKFLSSAEHNCRVSDLCPKRHKLWGLIHDITDGLGFMDLPRPLKYSPGMEAYRKYEKDALRTIARQLGLSGEMPKCVKQADNIMLVTEQASLTRGGLSDGNVESIRFHSAKPLYKIRNPWSHARAQREFLTRFYRLTRGRVTGTR